MNKILIIIVLALIVGVFWLVSPSPTRTPELPLVSPQSPSQTDLTLEQNPDQELFSLSIEALRQKEYPAGSFVIEETLPNGSNYRQLIVSYPSEGLKIYGLLTIPLAPKPEGGFPAIIFVHGYIPPQEYSTTGNYPTYQATLARSGMITFKPDLRGHGRSEGEAVSAHHSEKYVIDTLFAISSLKAYPDVNPKKLGYWGHSNGGQIGLRVAVISPDIRAFVFWAGVVGSFEAMLETHREQIPFLKDLESNPLVEQYGLPTEQPAFWQQIDPHAYLADISAPIQLHHGTRDASVPIALSRELAEALKQAGKKTEYFEYVGDDHNIGRNSGTAWQRSIAFFRDNL
jgi:dipeptidyl aminopeptidase/acylaminoacyl peptidase